MTPELLSRIRGVWANASDNPDHVILWAASLVFLQLSK